MTCLPDESDVSIQKITPNEIQQNMFKQFPEIPSWFIHTDKVKGVKRLLFSPQFIERKKSIFSEIPNQMKERKQV